MHPRDKAKVEVAVLVAQRWILARLRHETFFSLGALNARIAELLVELNDRPMRTYASSRRALFEAIERAALRPLPVDRFEFAHSKIATVHIDYHLEIEGHYYSVDHSLIHQRVDVRYTDRVVEVFVRGERHTSHVTQLRAGLLPCPQLLGATSSATSSHPVLRDRSSQQHVYFARWLAATGPTRALAAHRGFGDALESTARARREVRLASFDALFVDNHRILHGRRALEAGSRQQALPSGPSQG